MKVFPLHSFYEENLMRPKEIIAWISPADLAPWNGAEVPVRFVFTDTTILMEFGPPSEKQSFMERLRGEFAKIESSLFGQSLEIMRFLVATPTGQTDRDQLIDHIWSRIPTLSRIRNAICELNRRLKELQFAYVVKGSRLGVIKIELR